MKEVHDPTYTEECCHEATEAVRPVLNTFAVRTFRDEAQYDAGNQSEDYGDFKMIEGDTHAASYLLFLLRRDFIGVNHGQDI